jgi:DNA-binding MarR family transcriptional regulator
LNAVGYDPFVSDWLFVTIEPEYVNMADVNVSALLDRQTADSGTGEEPTWDIIELLFFAYRDFVGDPDEVLSKFGFGRAHHRVLHFVNRSPGMKVAELLDILKITKQSLGRVLKQLVDEGYVQQKEGASDRRQRLLYVTPKGEALAMKLAGLQTERITRALTELGPNAREGARRFLTAMIDPESRDGVLRFIAQAERQADRARRPRS